MNDLTQQLNNLPQLEMPEERFSEIQRAMNNRQFVKKHRIFSVASVLALMLVSALFFTQKNDLDRKDLLINMLIKRTAQLEQLLLSEAPNYSAPGGKITETIVNIEQYLVKLDEDIRNTTDKQRISELMATKIDVLGHLVLLQRKINHKPNYQKVKPYII